ncbi:AraC family transcriptional regulator [Enterovibrio sp. ZSDZ35]|uniref:AraC family transcriptional regulator n=1 Tax=Enterovibrio qingdaonensis TaxID=2899818 RepID=A0ABT5QQ76_9GAMM|nr:AraC family transcriptional regulator [Enterovibrio sp. ZSDZ35]MDD1783146.1 AraC family transcriptional regulator [Enterovibrio sp. ZSDZ35]
MTKGLAEENKSRQVYDVLQSNTAQLRNEVFLDNGLGVALWSNSHGTTVYDKPNHHTLSYYVQGGQNTKRAMRGGDLFGGEDKLCLMPINHRSAWHYADPFSFFHFYFEQSHLQSFAEQVFDKEGRHIELKECTFTDDPFITQLIRQTMLKLDWSNTTDQLMLSHAQQMMLLHLVRQHCHEPLRQALVTGGLSPVNQRRVMEYIDASLSRSFTLSDLAAITQLSDFHFARMFKVSFGCTPHQYVLGKRIERAKSLLIHSKSPLTDISAMCGFSSQQHLSQQFKQRVGASPASYRRNQNIKL